MRTDPITETEWIAIRNQLGPVLAARSYLTPAHEHNAYSRYAAALDALWALGCHPSVLGDPKSHQFVLKQQGGLWVAQWKRPKTKNWCIMPIPEGLAKELENYMAAPFDRRSIYKALRACAEKAGIPGVTPLTIRHTVGIRIFKALGPAAAKDSLQVGDRALQHYTALTAGTRLAALQNLMVAKTHEATKPLNQPGEGSA